MKTTGLLLLGMFIAMPVAAQEAEDAAAYEDAAAAYADGASTDAASEDAYADSAPSDDAAAFEDSGAAPADDAAAFEDSGAAPADAAAAFADSGSGDASAADFADTGSTDESAGSSDSAPAEDYDPAAAFANDSTESYTAPPQATPGAAAYGAEPYSADSGSDSYGSDEGYGDSSSESSEPERDPIQLYAGADYAWLTASLSSDQLKAKFGGDEFDSRFYRGRFGTRLFGKIGVEGQFGFSDTDDTEPGDVEVSEYVGVFIVPTGVIFDLIEVAAPIGYSVTELSGRGVSHKFDAFSFGINLEIPLLIGVENFPDIRIGGGGTVYQAEREARVYGYHAGIRFDFNI